MAGTEVTVPTAGAALSGGTNNANVYWSGATTVAADTSFTRTSDGVYSLTTLTATTSLVSPTVYGSASASGTLTLSSTSHATKGTITAGSTLVIDEATRLSTFTATSTANAVNAVLTLVNNNASGTAPGTSFGTGILFKGTDGSRTAGDDNMAQIESKWSVATAGSENSTFSVFTRLSGAALTETFRCGYTSGGATATWLGIPATNGSSVQGTSVFTITSATTPVLVFQDANLTTYRAGRVDCLSLNLNHQTASSGAHTFFKVTGVANTGQTASTEIPGVNLALNVTRQWATGALALQREVLISAPTYGFVGASTVSLAYTVDITGAPAAGTNATITAGAGLRVVGGIVCGSAALATNATQGFLYVPSCAGTPTGTPEAHTGTVALIYDTTNNKMYVYNGAWKGGTAPGAWS